VKRTCEIWEYGPHDHVKTSAATGNLQELRSAMARAHVQHTVVVNCFSIDEWRARFSAGLIEGLRTGRLPSGQRASLLSGWLIGFNEWLVASVQDVPEITPFVAFDPWLLTEKDTREHLEDMRRRGAKGVKLHPVEQRLGFLDETMQHFYRLCADLDLTILSHSGASRGGFDFGHPRTFGQPPATSGLRLIVAHLGGGHWQHICDLAERWQQVTFDLSEIVSWIGAPHAPSAKEIVAIIRRIGVERVMFGSDFPWYDPDVVMNIVASLPGLSVDESAAILGENAIRILRLPG
jgi:predicted TIM-barrel fold metal-dependent hydrolase